ncbi:MAG: UDP-N-acetylmuramate dehydrogenase [bacterium]|nr:UDP-N-acetylmuramate dehydrogenase [bacterium]
MAFTQEAVSAFLSAFPEAKQNEPLAPHTTWRMGGPAKLFLTVSSVDQLLTAIKLADAQKIPWVVMGGGTNVLIPDEGFEGLVLQPGMRGIEVLPGGLRLEAGALTTLVGRKSVEAGFEGFEWAAGLPGTIGGALYGNAGCYGGEMKDAVVTVDAYRIKDGQRVSLSNVECRFDYRDSLFKHEAYVILGCELKLQPANDTTASRELLNKIFESRQKQQPLGRTSAGCIFKNPKVREEDVKNLLQKGLKPMFGHDSKVHVAAGWLIEQVGMKGYRIGDVEVSDKHANFFLSGPQAKAQDVIALISAVKMKVRDELGIQLEEEVQYLGF